MRVTTTALSTLILLTSSNAYIPTSNPLQQQRQRQYQQKSYVKSSSLSSLHLLPHRHPAVSIITSTVQKISALHMTSSSEENESKEEGRGMGGEIGIGGGEGAAAKAIEEAEALAVEIAPSAVTTTTAATVLIQTTSSDSASDSAMRKNNASAAINAATTLVDEMVDETCEVDDMGEPADELCVDDSAMEDAKAELRGLVGTTLGLVGDGCSDDSSSSSSTDGIDDITVGDIPGSTAAILPPNAVIDAKLVRTTTTLNTAAADDDDRTIDTDIVSNLRDDVEDTFDGEELERGWERRGNSSAIRRNAEVWRFALGTVFRALKPRKIRKAGGSEEEISKARRTAAIYLKNGLLKLGPSFVKLGQVISTRTDVLAKEYTDTLKTLQDDVPGFSGERAKRIVTEELGRPYNEIYQNFSDKPLAAASLGQVHTAMYKGKKVAIKVQRAGLKALFDSDLKNLKKLAALLDKFDPKTDGADRNWVSIYEESERLLYEEIDYELEASNSERFARDFQKTPWVIVPKVYKKVSTPRVLTMEFVESFKLTDIERVEKEGLNKELLARRTADSFLKQIVETGYFHCDPHPGNLCVDTKGNLVFYDYGMMDELKPKVRSGFRKFCTALFAGGPTISDLDLIKNAKMLVDGVEEAGVLARGADRLAVEKLARYYMRSFKNKQLGKESTGIKATMGTDLQTLTENNVFRFPSTFTFIFRSFASIDGIGKGLDPNYDIGKLAQPFVEEFTDAQKGYKSEADKGFSIFRKATGLNVEDINTAITTPKKVAYIEETLRSMEDGSLKVRVRSLENEKALERMELTQGRMENLVIATLFANIAGIAAGPAFVVAGVTGAAIFSLKAVGANTKIKKFDKTQAKFVQTKFEGDDDE